MAEISVSALTKPLRIFSNTTLLFGMTGSSIGSSPPGVVPPLSSDELSLHATTDSAIIAISSAKIRNLSRLFIVTSRGLLPEHERILCYPRVKSLQPG